MSDYESDLKRLFAQSREDFDGAAFRGDVDRRIAKARKVRRFGEIAWVMAIGVAALAASPLLMQMWDSVTAGALALADNSTDVAGIPVFALITAAVSSAVALVVVRT